jgi:hypothetical protein
MARFFSKLLTARRLWNMQKEKEMDGVGFEQYYFHPKLAVRENGKH